MGRAVLQAPAWSWLHILAEHSWYRITCPTLCYVLSEACAVARRQWWRSRYTKAPVRQVNDQAAPQWCKNTHSIRLLCWAAPAVVAQQVHKVHGRQAREQVLHVQQHGEQHAARQVVPLPHQRQRPYQDACDATPNEALTPVEDGCLVPGTKYTVRRTREMPKASYHYEITCHLARQRHRKVAATRLQTVACQRAFCTQATCSGPSACSNACTFLVHPEAGTWTACPLPCVWHKPTLTNLQWCERGAVLTCQVKTFRFQRPD